MIRILICDDQDVVRKGLQIILRHSEGIEVVGTAVDGEDAIAQATALKPDVVLMDLKMPKLNGIHATRHIVTNLPQTKVVVLTTYDGDEWLFDAIRAGASSYLLKDSDAEVIITAVRQAAAGQSQLDPQIAGKILQEFNRLDQQSPPTHTLPPLAETLSERELSILQLMAQGKNNQEIADELFLAIGTVKNNISAILGKLQATDRTQAVLAALRRGIVSLE